MRIVRLCGQGLLDSPKASRVRDLSAEALSGKEERQVRRANERGILEFKSAHTCKESYLSLKMELDSNARKRASEDIQ